MKPLALFVLLAGVASATAITFNSNDTGILYLSTSQNVNAPAGITYAVGPSGSIGGLCAGTFGSPPPNSACPSTAGTTPDRLTFSLPTTGTLRIRLQDEFIVVDVYQLLLTPQGGSTSVWQSSSVNQNGSVAQGCWDSAVSNSANTNSCLDVTTGILAAGNYTIDIWDIILSYTPTLIGTGTDPFDQSTLQANPTSGYSPAHLAIDLTFTPVVVPVPEPATFGMLGLGGIALGLFRRFRK